MPAPQLISSVRPPMFSRLRTRSKSSEQFEKSLSGLRQCARLGPLSFAVPSSSPVFTPAEADRLKSKPLAVAFVITNCDPLFPDTSMRHQLPVHLLRGSGLRKVRRRS